MKRRELLSTADMSEALQTIEFLSTKIRSKEEEAARLKKLVNELCVEAGVAPRYASIPEPGDSTDGTIRRDQFYGQTLITAARSYLDLRKARGAASFQEIFKAVRDGGYKFDTKDDENAKAALRAVLRKNSSIFHRIPNGDFGLLAWYPNAKISKEADEGEGDDEKAKSLAKPETATARAADDNFLSNTVVREAIFQIAAKGEFSAADVEGALTEGFPKKEVRHGAIATQLFTLSKKGLLRMVAERSGSKGATYAKA